MTRAGQEIAILEALDAEECETVYQAALRALAEGANATQKRSFVARVLLQGPGDEAARIERAARVARPEPVPCHFPKRRIYK